MEKFLEITNLSKNFKEKKILDKVNLQIAEGEILGLIGINAVGKTTLIKMIIDLLSIDSGEIKLFGKDVSEKTARSNISYLPEKFAPSPYLQGKEFLQISAQHMGIEFDYDVIAKLALRLDFNISYLDKNIKNYSKGMGQKLGLIAVFMSKKPFLLLDEPMSGLDPHIRIRLKDMLREHALQKNSVFFSSHILSDMEEICDKIAVLHDSKLIYHGLPEDFKKKYTGDSLERAFLKAINK